MVGQATAKDFNNNALNISISVQEKGVARTLDEFKSQTPFDGLSNTKLYNITFSATDPRWKSGTDASWEPYLKISNSHEISVIATPPKLELFFHEPRSALPEIDHGNKIIPFLVRSKGDFKDLDAFKDDGEFKISPDPGEGKRDSRKLYYKATAYDGLGDEITHLNLVDLDGVEAVDSETLNSDSIITLSINDQSIRGSGVTGGAKSEISYTVDVVDVISPLISIVDHEDPVEGIMPEIYLLSGKIKDQVRGNSHEKYYFPDPGLVILDNYYNQEEITNYNNITVDNEYVFDYVYEAVTKTYNSVWEFPNRALDISVVGSYEIFYSINDPSGNLSKNFDDPNSAEVSRQVNVVDSRNPIVKLYGSSTMYVDLQSIIDQESRFLDPGAYAIENLYVSGKGLFDWKTVDSDLVWDVSYSLCNDLENDTYDEPVRPDDGSDLIESTIQGYLDDPDRLPTEAIRFKVTYALKDKPFLNNSPNEGDVTRIVELRGSPNLFPHIYFVLNHPDNEDGIPSKSNIEGNIAKLPKLIWKVEVGVDQFSAVPNAIVFNDLGGDVRENVQYSTSLLFLDEKNQTRSNPTYSYAISDYLKKVNYWDKQLSSPYYILFNEESNTYLKYPEGNQNWRRVVIRYSSSENEVGNRSIRDLEIRLVDESEPSLQKNAFENKPIEVGEPFVDPGVEVLDKANSEVGLNKFIDIDHPQGLDDNSTFDELAARGFWTTGDYTITYNATDEFGNQAESQTLNLRVQDSIDPHVAVVTHEVLEKYNSGNDLSFSDLSYQDGNDPIVSPNEVFMNDANLQSSLASLSNLYKDFKFSSEVPFLLENNSKDFLLKSSELDDDFLQNLKGNPKELVLTTSKVVSITDDFGRSYLWYSPFKLTFDDGSSLQDPGFLIFEPSDSGVTIDATLRTEFFGDNQDQIKLVSVNLAITQSNTSARQTSISDAREYLFLDDVKPILQISPQTNAISTFVKVEAGYDYEDTAADNSKFPILEDGIVRVEDGEVLSVSAYDLSDGDVSANITRKVEDLNGSGVTNVETGYDYVNHIYKIEYNATDSADPPNFADPVYRYLKIVDSTPPLIYPQSGSGLTDNFEIDYLGNAPDPNDEDEVKDYLLQGLVASDYGAKGAGNGQVIDANLDWSNSSYRDKWEVVITKPDGSAFEPGEVFPFANNGVDEGYDVNITVTDEFGNTSLPKIRKLKVGDYKKPTISLIGSSEIHDFLRFSKNKDLENNELYFTDRPVGDLNLEYNSTGFSGGAHRILHADYNFIDPGVYAEDDNSYFGIGDGFKDLDGDGIGETYAIRRVDERSKMVDCNDNNPNTNDIGVIFAYSVLEKVTNPTLHFQNLLFNDTFGINTESLADYVNFPATDDENNTVSIAAVKVPDLDNNVYDFNSSDKDNRTNLDVVKITIEYRVKDGWDNFSDIKERLVFIYESRQFPGFAFYATPLTDGDGGPFEQYYDNGRGLPFLNSTRKDTDGDGVSDYWELAFGSNPEDRTSIPSHDLSDPKVYNDINFTISNTP